MYVSSQITYPKLVNDSLVVITPKQLKITNLIFLEHRKLKLEVPELNRQIDSYALMTANLNKTDSIRRQQLERAKLQMQLYDEAIQAQNRQLSKMVSKNKRLTVISIGGCTLSIGLLVFLLLK